MGVSRRTIVKAIGGASIALVGAGGTFAATRTPHRALAPWASLDDRPPVDVRLDAFRHAVLAPNPHNRQPWLIKLVGAHEALVFCDLEKRLPQTDPLDRQILIGFGCFFELARIAALQRDVQMDMTPFPEGLPGDRLDQRPIARLRFRHVPVGEKDPLFSAIATRRTAKKPFDTARVVAEPTLAALRTHATPSVLVSTTADLETVAALRALTWEAWNVELQTKRTWQETVDLMRIGRSEIEANPDGVSIGGPVLEALALVGQFSREQASRPGTAAYVGAIDRYRPILATSMAFAWISTAGNTRAEQLATGQVYVRMNLEAARLGLGFHPVSQALQEFPEMAASLANVTSKLSAPSGHRPQMLIRLGYGSPVATTPRWPLRSKLIGS